MRKVLSCITISICAIIIILISVFTNILLGIVLLFIGVTLCLFIKYPRISIERLIVLAVFLAPCSNIFVFKTGYIDLKILQFMWAAIFVFILIQKALIKNLSVCKTVNINNSVIFAIYITGLLLSCLFSINMSISIKELFQYIYLFLMMYLIYINAHIKDFFNKIIATLIVSNIVLVCSCLISYFTGKMLIPSFYMFPNGAIEVLDNVYRAQTLLESSNIINRISGVMGLDSIAIANCILIQSLVINYKIKNSIGKLRALYMIIFLANAVTISITYSRAALIIFLIVNFITLMGKNRKLNFLLIILSIFSIPLLLSLLPNLYERILEAFNPQEGSTKYHFVYWLMALREGYDYIFTGIGLGNAAFQQEKYVDMFRTLFRMFDLYNADGANIHNFILQIWAEQGFVGLLANVILIFSPIIHFVKVKFIRKNIREKTVYDYIILAYVATLIYNLTNNNFYIEMFWVLLALVYACKDKFVAEPESTETHVLRDISIN